MYINPYKDGEIEKHNIYTFAGLNRTHSGKRNEFADMLNMSGDEYPCAAPRKGREVVAESIVPINAVAAPDSTNTDAVTGITGISGGGFYYNGVLKSDKTELKDSWDWQIERMGNLYIIHGYDSAKKQSETYYYNIDTDKFTQKGVMKNLIVNCGTDYIELYSYGYDYVVNYSVATPDGEVIANKDYFDTYCKNGLVTPPGDNIFEQYGFSVGDEITIEGFPNVGTDCPGQIWYRYGGEVRAADYISTEFNNTVDTDEMTVTDNVSKHANVSAFVKSFYTSASSSVSGQLVSIHRMYLDLYTKDGSQGALDVTATDTTPLYVSGITVRKRRRNFTNIAAHHGRVWGSVPSGNTLYASSSDDISSFTSNDISKCYGARLVSDTAGVFTALASFNNELVAFKPDSITVVSGTNPKNYYTNVIDGVGCISKKSVAVTPQGIIFLGHKGFYIFDGSMPKLLSEKLNTRYTDAVSGFDGDIYYAAATRTDGARELLKYDLRRGLWHKEDDINAIGFFRFGADFFIVDDRNIYRIADSPDSATSWEFTSVITRDYNLDNKAISEIWVLADVSEGGYFKVWTAADDKEWIMHSAFSESGLKLHRCPVRAPMSTSYRYKISGAGNVVIHEIEFCKSESDGRRYKEREGTITPQNKPEQDLLIY